MSRLETKKQSWRRQPQQSPASYSAGSIHWFTQSGHGRLRFPPIKCHHELDKIWERQQLFIWVTYTPFYGPEPSQTMLDKIWERRQLFIWVTYRHENVIHLGYIHHQPLLLFSTALEEVA